MGWTIGSDVPRQYIHLNTQQVDDVIARYNGIESDTKPMIPQSLICGCGRSNPSSGRYCYSCGRVLKVSYALEDQSSVQEQTDATVREMLNLLKDPAMMQAFTDFKLQRMQQSRQ